MKKIIRKMFSVFTTGFIFANIAIISGVMANYTCPFPWSNYGCYNQLEGFSGQPNAIVSSSVGNGHFYVTKDILFNGVGSTRTPQGGDCACHWCTYCEVLDVYFEEIDCTEDHDYIHSSPLGTTDSSVLGIGIPEADENCLWSVAPEANVSVEGEDTTLCTMNFTNTGSYTITLNLTDVVAGGCSITGVTILPAPTHFDNLSNPAITHAGESVTVGGRITDGTNGSPGLRIQAHLTTAVEGSHFNNQTSTTTITSSENGSFTVELYTRDGKSGDNIVTFTCLDFPGVTENHVDASQIRDFVGDIAPVLATWHIRGKKA